MKTWSDLFEERLPSPTRIFAILVVAAVAVRLLALWILPAQAFPDSAAYAQAGKDLFESGIIQNHFCMPLYPIFMGLVGGIEGIRYLDIVLSSLTAGLIGYLTLDLWKGKLGMALAGLAAVVYPYFVFYSISGLSENSFIFFLVLGFFFLNRDRWVAGSVALILGILIRPAIDLVAPILVFLYAFLIFRRGWKKAILRTGVYFILYALFLAPWWVHNLKKYDGRFVRLNLSTGYVLYSGNNPMNTSGGGIGGVDLDESQFESIPNIFDRDAAMKKAAVDFIRENPGKFIQLSLVKFLRYWRLWPYASQYSSNLYVILSLLSFAPVLGLAIFSLFRFARNEWIRTLPILLLFAYMTAVHMVTIASIRYRLPLEPFLIVFAIKPLLNWMNQKTCPNTASNA